MREPLDRERLYRFMRELGRSARTPCKIYLTGGACALLYDWRQTTVDIDLSLHPELDDLFRAIPRLKEDLQVNVELASPTQFVPELPGWQERSVFIETVMKTAFYHYDFYSQALAKLERGHERDLTDIQAMLAANLVEPERLLALFEEIEPQLIRYPAIDPPSLRRRVMQLTGRDSAC